MNHAREREKDLGIPCPVCSAMTGEDCVRVDGRPLTLDDEREERIVHFGRRAKRIFLEQRPNLSEKSS